MNGLHYRASCLCGWQSREFSNAVAAESAKRAHEAGQTSRARRALHADGKRLVTITVRDTRRRPR